MRQKSGIREATSEKVVKEIRRATRKTYKFCVGQNGAEFQAVLQRLSFGVECGVGYWAAFDVKSTAAGTLTNFPSSSAPSIQS